MHVNAVSHPDVFWCRLNAAVWAPKKGAQKSSYNTFSIYISHKNWMKYSYEYLKTKIFTNILPQMHWTSVFLDTQLQPLGVFGVSQNYPILNLKKTVFPKKRLDAAL